MKGLNAMITIDQSHAVISTLTVNVDWSVVEFTHLQQRIKEDPQGMGKDFTRFLQAGARMPLNMVIDMDVPSKTAPRAWKVKEEDQLPNRVRGQVEWDPANTSLFLSENQRKDYSGGHDLRKALEGQVVYNDNVVDFYLDHPEVPTPKEWLGKWIFCWGRIYRGSDDRLIVRCLYCGGDGSRGSNYFYLDNFFNSLDPALVAGKSFHFSPFFLSGEFSFESCFTSWPFHPPSIFPISSIFNDRAMYFLLSSDFVSQRIMRSTFKRSVFLIAKTT